jgi:SpoVK/Ycf46/Vps4 family AAA+-type ATPase
MYKNVFLNLQLGTREDEKKLLITSLVAYYNVETGFPYEDFSSFYVESKNTSPKIGIIKSGRGGMYISKLTLNYKQEFSFDHYNEDFPEFENHITTQLSEKTPGLYLLHGDPGTGKSSAIRHLVKSVNRNFIFIPPQMISHLSSPEFADIITDTHKGSVLILEDAEKALMKRESEDGFSNSTLVSSILNLTDGLYADLAQLAIIATYNCDRNLIDPALLRKGRLKSEYRFNKLNVKKAKTLAEKLDKNIDVTEDMSLADIFNYEDQFTNNKQPEKRFVGFGR